MQLHPPPQSQCECNAMPISTSYHVFQIHWMFIIKCLAKGNGCWIIPHKTGIVRNLSSSFLIGAEYRKISRGWARAAHYIGVIYSYWPEVPACVYLFAYGTTKIKTVKWGNTINKTITRCCDTRQTYIWRHKDRQLNFCTLSLATPATVCFSNSLAVTVFV